MKYLLVLFILSFISCKSQDITTQDYKIIFSEEVKEDLLKNISKTNKNYILLSKNTDKKLYEIQLRDCKNCYFEELIDESKEIINLDSKVNVSIINESSIKNYESDEEVVIRTGGSYIIEVDYKGNIIKSYIGD
ncbi:hypothetical protein [Winogradskyella luteola]|uniref:Uncharacterized protein n=1 Tax=Winogradskyella luteola TaxID=2828330 RepID=A0A9X1FCN9_9FLAO|nr:hypothetical protein [Winogradskyella luteola]MBV7270658.1 hypothetical protein [Winogradskyella luteola]